MEVLNPPRPTNSPTVGHRQPPRVLVSSMFPSRSVAASTIAQESPVKNRRHSGPHPCVAHGGAQGDSFAAPRENSGWLSTSSMQRENSGWLSASNLSYSAAVPAAGPPQSSNMNWQLQQLPSHVQAGRQQVSVRQSGISPSTSWPPMPVATDPPLTVPCGNMASSVQPSKISPLPQRPVSAGARCRANSPYSVASLSTTEVSSPNGSANSKSPGQASTAGSMVKVVYQYPHALPPKVQPPQPPAVTQFVTSPTLPIQPQPPLQCQRPPQFILSAQPPPRTLARESSSREPDSDRLRSSSVTGPAADSRRALVFNGNSPAEVCKTPSTTYAKLTDFFASTRGASSPAQAGTQQTEQRPRQSTQNRNSPCKTTAENRVAREGMTARRRGQLSSRTDEPSPSQSPPRTAIEADVDFQEVLRQKNHEIVRLHAELANEEIARLQRELAWYRSGGSGPAPAQGQSRSRQCAENATGSNRQQRTMQDRLDKIVCETAENKVAWQQLGQEMQERFAALQAQLSDLTNRRM